MSATPPPPSRILGRWTTRILVWGLVLSVVAAIVLLAQGNDAFFAALLIVAVLGYANAALPAALFVVYAGRRPPPEVPRNMRQAVWASAVVLILFGAWLIVGIGGALSLIIGAAGAALGVVAIVRMIRFTPPVSSDAQLAYGRSTAIGIFLSLLILLALPKFACGCGDGKGKAYRAMLKSDLRNLGTAEEGYFVDHKTYALRAQLDKDASFYASTGDSLVVVAADAHGWHATGTHWNLPNVTCGIWVGTRPADGMHGAGEGQVLCWSS